MLKWKLKEATSVADFEKLEELAKEPNYELGVQHRMTLQKTTNNLSYLILNQDDVVVGYITAHILSPTLVYRHQAFLEKKYRKKGSFNEMVGQINQELVAVHGVDLDSGQNVYNNNDISLLLFRRFPGIVFGPKILPFFGNLTADLIQKLQPQLSSDIQIKMVKTQSDMELIKSYDHTIHPMSRDRYLDAWLGPGNELTLTSLAVNASGACVGYANLSRISVSFYFTAPAYAEGSEICIAMFKRLWEQVPVAEFWSALYFPAEQRDMLALVQQLGWKEQDKSEVRCYSKQAIPLPWEKVFCLHEYFLC